MWMDETKESIKNIILGLSDLRYGDDFVVLDLTDESDRKVLESDFKDLLRSWKANLCHRYNGRIVKGVPKGDVWNDFLRELGNRDFNGFSVPVYFYHTLNGFMKDAKGNTLVSRYDTKADRETYRKTPKLLMLEARKKWRQSGIVTNDEVADDSDSWLFIHFDDNDIYRIRGMTDDGQFHSEGWSAERFFEVLFSQMHYPDRDYAKFMEDSLRTYCLHEG